MSSQGAALMILHVVAYNFLFFHFRNPTMDVLEVIFFWNILKTFCVTMVTGEGTLNLKVDNLHSEHLPLVPYRSEITLLISQCSTISYHFFLYIYTFFKLTTATTLKISPSLSAYFRSYIDM